MCNSATPTILSPAGATSLDFGNFCSTVSNARSSGYWSNGQGLAVLQTLPGVLGFLGGLNLRNADGSDFDPATLTAFQTWLSGANGVNMAYSLSAQLAAMELNVLAGYVSGSTLILGVATVDGTTITAACADSAGFCTVDALMAEANAALAADGFTPSGDPNRPYQEALKDMLQSGNTGGGVFVQPHACSTSFSAPSCSTP